MMVVLRCPQPRPRRDIVVVIELDTVVFDECYAIRIDV